MNAVVCQHIREVGVKTMYKEKVELRKSDLDDLSHEGEFKMIKRERIDQCISLSHAASKNNADIIVSFEDGERYIHFSVYDGDIHYYSKLGRVIVTCDVKNGIWIVDVVAASVAAYIRPFVCGICAVLTSWNNSVVL